MVSLGPRRRFRGLVRGGVAEPRLLYQRLVYDPGRVRSEGKSEKFAKVVVMEGSGCSRYVREYSEGDVGQRRRRGRLM